MEQKKYYKFAALFLFATLFLAGMMFLLVPVLNKAFFVEVLAEVPKVTEPEVPGKPEERLITAIYEMEEQTKKITGVYIEVYTVGNHTVSWFEIPADTKINLSEDLYKSLQTYAPELPQYFKLSNMAESFSEEYGLIGCNRILSEVLGITVQEYVRSDKDGILRWKEALGKENKDNGFFADYAKWLEKSSSGLMTEERWIYYESLKQVTLLQLEQAPGSQEKDGYLISGKRSKERLQELMLLRDNDGQNK